jgi:hypothetical protein
VNSFGTAPGHAALLLQIGVTIMNAICLKPLPEPG